MSAYKLKGKSQERRLEQILKGCCPMCEQPINTGTFRDSQSLAEYQISRLCQDCQDKLFGK